MLTAAFVAQQLMMLGVPILLMIVLRRRWRVAWLVMAAGAAAWLGSQVVHVPLLLRHGEIAVDASRHRCTVGDAVIELTAKEFGLLQTLMSRPGHVFSRDRLLELVWGEDVTVTTRTIDTHLKRLREKLGDSGDAIDTVRGVGYRFRE